MSCHVEREYGLCQQLDRVEEITISTSNVTTDAFHRIGRKCPIDVEVLSVDEEVEVALGSHHGFGAAVRLVMSDPDTCHRLAQAFIQARNLLVQTVYEAVPEPSQGTERVATFVGCASGR